ncbi:DUF4013 domain-containing protein [Arabiibacter massiliensis]|uniref:DUF4013 domain-containing protein n=1 Tax=Arabiibacter massiliensis TaxID=1870985 RepID=UPI0009BAB3E0|nr:DUF4013 domain-containing protein [Arabiibacter massiliensis]
MQSGYFAAAWHDIKGSPGWLGKLVILALVSLIPIFGWIVVYGYLFGWARDIAWDAHSPLPARIFGNEDGKLYSRGFFALLITTICLLIPWALEMVWGMLTGFGTFWSDHGYGMSMLGLATPVFSLLIMAAIFLATLFSWVGAMRTSIYGRLAPGLQFGRIWAMMRHDFQGLLRILGMAVLLAVGAGLVAWLLVMVLVFVGLVVGMIVTGGNLDVGGSHSGAGVWMMAMSVMGIVFSLVAVYGAFMTALSVFVLAMVARALGYWTRQFGVPSWRGQDDPMPFELAGGMYGGQVPPPGQPPVQR